MLSVSGSTADIGPRNLSTAATTTTSSGACGSEEELPHMFGLFWPCELQAMQMKTLVGKVSTRVFLQLSGAKKAA